MQSQRVFPANSRFQTIPFIFAILFIFFISGCLWGEGAKKSITLDSVIKDGVMLGRNIGDLQWHPLGKMLSYLKPVGSARNAPSRLYGFDVENKSERVLWDAQENQEKIVLSSYQWPPQGGGLFLVGGNDFYLVNPESGEKKRLTQDGEAKEFPTFSPTGEFIAYYKKGNLFALNLRSGKTQQLTFDGSENILNGRLDWVYEEELADRRSGRSFEWAPNGRKIVFLRLDQSRVPAYPLIDFLPTHSGVTLQRYPQSGDSNAIPSVHVVTVGGRRPKKYDCPVFLPPGKKREDAIEYVGPAFSWTRDSKGVALLTLNRRQDELVLYLWKPEEKQVAPLLTEKDETWINSIEPPRFLRDGRFFWLSERDGWMHLYLYDAQGRMIRQLTRGEWMIDGDIEVDREEKQVFFVSNSGNLRQRQIQRVALDGGNVVPLTLEAGTHSMKLSPNGHYFLDQFSSLTQPTENRLIDARGTLLGQLPGAENHLDDYLLAQTEFVEVKASDGKELFGALVKPADFDPTKKYPVVVSVYGGPHVQAVTDKWGTTTLFDHFLAQEGFLIWSLDNRGSYGRGHAWESAIFKNLGKRELEDQLVGVEYLKRLPYVDASRIGIWGGSYGGYMTLYALTYAPGVFQCGISMFPVTDWRFYDSIYTERYMNIPADNVEGYKNNSPLRNSDKLADALLLVHGTADDNVHLQNSMQLVDALIKARKPFELQIYPGQKHGIRGEEPRLHFQDAAYAFFKRHLKPNAP